MKLFTRKPRTLTLILLGLFLSAPASAQLVNISHTGITDETGAPLAHGLECFTPVSNNGTPIPAAYPGGTVTKSQKCFNVVNGVLASGVTLVKSNVTSPQNLCYQMTLKNTDTSVMVIGPSDGFGCIQPTGDLNLNTITPNLPALSLVTAGPQGQSAYAAAVAAGFNGSQSQWLASLVGPPGPVTTAQLNAAIATAIGGTTTPSANVFNVAALMSGAVQYTTGAPAALSGYSITPKMLTNGASHYVTNGLVGFYSQGGYGPTFFDANGNNLGSDLLSMTTGNGQQSQNDDDSAAGTVHPIPAGAVSFQLYFHDSTQPVAYSQLMVITGTNPTLPGAYIAYGSTTTGGVVTSAQLNAVAAIANSAATTAANSASSVSPWTGKNMCVVGDSISTANYPTSGQAPWQVKVAQILGANLYWQNFWPGRSMSHALDNSGENAGNPAPSITIVSGCDFLFLFISTNLDVQSVAGVGAVTDSANAAAGSTYAAQLRAVLIQYQSWNPAMRIFWVSDYQTDRYSTTGFSNQPMDSNSAPILKAIHDVGSAVAQSLSIPVVDLWSDSGINAYSYQQWLYTDGVHPSQVGANNVLAPVIAHRANQLARQ